MTEVLFLETAAKEQQLKEQEKRQLNVYHSATEAEQKEFMKAFIERIEMFPEKRKDGSRKTEI